VTILLQKRSATELAIGKSIVVWPWGNLFSFYNQLLHFFACRKKERERERASLRKIFFIMDYILPGCKGLFFIITDFEIILLHKRYAVCPERERERACAHASRLQRILFYNN
jgi:hypothetical protein